MPTAERNPIASTAGRVLHRAAGYDLVVWLWTLGRERTFREKLLSFAGLTSGESVLDIGCGTGTLAIAAGRQVGPTGRVYGIDASPEMIARAERKAKRAGAKIRLQNAIAESLPFPDAQFDAVLSTVMLHHLPRPARARLVAEARRVLRPGGRLLVIDFAKPAAPRPRGILGHLHRHGHIGLDEVLAMVSEAGLHVQRSGDVGTSDLQFVLATKP